MHDKSRGSRRDWLKACAGAGAIGISGCLRLTEGDTETPDDTDTAERSGEEESNPEEDRNNIQEISTPSVSPMLRYDATNVGHPSPVAEIDEPTEHRWEFETSGIQSAPALAGTVIVVTTIGGKVVALDRATGETRWQYEDDRGVYASPTVVDGTVFVGTQSERVYALDITDGSVLWNVETEEPVESTIVVGDDSVFALDTGATLYAFAPEDGHERWHTVLGDRIRDRIPGPSPAIAGDMVIASNGRNRQLVAVSASDGSERWRHDLELDVHSSLAVLEGVALVTGRAATYAIEVDGGRERWRTGTVNGEIFGGPTGLIGQPAAAEGTVFVGSVEFLNAFDLEDGSAVWSTRTFGNMYTPPVVVDDTVYAGCDDGYVYAFDRADGTEHWSYDFGQEASVIGAPAVGDGQLYVPLHEGRLTGGVVALTRSNSAAEPE